ncbi:MAG: YqjK family protein [Pseudomonadota bacterium]|jgi:hypothetical protein
MMSGSRAAAYASRRERLLARAAQERARIAELGGEVAAPLAGVDRAREALLWIRARPGVLVAAAAALGIARPRGVLRALVWVARGWAVARALRTSEARVGWMLLPRLIDAWRGWRRR